MHDKAQSQMCTAMLEICMRSQSLDAKHKYSAHKNHQW